MKNNYLRFLNVGFRKDDWPDPLAAQWNWEHIHIQYGWNAGHHNTVFVNVLQVAYHTSV